AAKRPGQHHRPRNDGRTQLRRGTLPRSPRVLRTTARGGTSHTRCAQTCVTDRGKTRRHRRRHSLCSASQDGISAGEDRQPRGNRPAMMPSSHDVPGVDRGCGDRLRTAREAAGLTIAEVSQRLKMPVRVVEALEAGEPRVEAQVFVRGQLRSYARLLGVRLDDVPVASGACQVEPAPIVPMSYTPPLQRFADKLMGRMVYIVITAFIVVP